MVFNYLQKFMSIYTHKSIFQHIKFKLTSNKICCVKMDTEFAKTIVLFDVDGTLTKPRNALILFIKIVNIILGYRIRYD